MTKVGVFGVDVVFDLMFVKYKSGQEERFLKPKKKSSPQQNASKRKGYRGHLRLTCSKKKTNG
jgi:hypothetical protein